MIIATCIQKSPYGNFNPCLIVNETGQRYVSQVAFVTPEDAMKEAEQWKTDSEEIGQIVQY